MEYIKFVSRITCLIGGGEGQRQNRRKKSQFSVNSKRGLPSLGCNKEVHSKEGVSFDAAICLVQSETPFLATGRIVPVQVQSFHCSWRGFAAELVMKMGVCHQLAPWPPGGGVLHGVACSSVLACAPIDSPAVGEGISGAPCPARLRGAWWPCVPKNQSNLRAPCRRPWQPGSLFPGQPGSTCVDGTPLVFWQSGHVRWSSYVFD